MALYHKLDVKNGFDYVLTFFSLISDGLGSVNTDNLLIRWFHDSRIYEFRVFFHKNESCYLHLQYIRINIVPFASFKFQLCLIQPRGCSQTMFTRGGG